jgi:hypothetical protein
MGLYVHSLSRLPLGLEREYYLYILDYGWDEPLGAALHANFRRMADLAAKSDAVVIAGTDSRAFAEEIISVHVDDPQFSFKSVNGEDGDSVLPALMISTIHPRKFKETSPGYRFADIAPGIADDRLVLIPLRGICKDSTEVISLIERIFKDIAAKKPLIEFQIAKQIHAKRPRSSLVRMGGAISDAIILKPAVMGIGVDFRELLKSWRSLK